MHTPKPRNTVRYTHKQWLAIAFLLCFMLVSLLSEAFILTQADHTHDHNGPHDTCAVCAQLQQAEHTLKLLATATVAGLASAGFYIFATIVRAKRSSIALLTPITAKTRMNN